MLVNKHIMIVHTDIIEKKLLGDDSRFSYSHSCLYSDQNPLIKNPTHFIQMDNPVNFMIVL